MGRMPTDVRENFKKDACKLLDQLKYSMVDEKTGEKGYLLTVKLLYVEAHK
jgi:hypothetical protein